MLARSGGGRGRGRCVSTNALLQKVNSQLHGEIVATTAEEDEERAVGAYLSSLSRKKTATSQPQWDKFGELSDLSDSEKEQNEPAGFISPRRETPAASKFIKKKPKSLETPPEAPAPKTSDAMSTNKFLKQSTPLPSATVGRSTALSKVAAFTSKYDSKPQKGVLELSDSDMDLSLSMDEDVLKDVQNLHSSKAGKTASTLPKKTYVRTPSPDSSGSEQFGKGGNRFMKKAKPAAKKVEPEPSSAREVKKKTTFADDQNAVQAKKPAQSMFTLKSAEKYSTQVVLDTDEESLAQYVDGLSGSAATTPRSPKTVRGILKTPRTPPPMEDIREEEDDIDSLRSASEPELEAMESDPDSVSSAASFKMNIMDLDALEPAIPLVMDTKPKKSKQSSKHSSEISEAKKKTEKTAKKSTKHDTKDSVLADLGVFTVDDLLGVKSDSDAGGDKDSEPDYDSDFEPTTRSQSPLRSILSPTPRAATPRSARGRVRYSLDDITEIPTRSPTPEAISTHRGSVTSVAYSENFDESASEIPTAPQTEYDSRASTPQYRRQRSYSGEYSDDFTVSESRTTRQYSRSSSYDETETASYTESYTSQTETATTTSRTPSPRPRVKSRHSVPMHSTSVQTGLDLGDLSYHWSIEKTGTAIAGPAYGLSAVDPSPIATHVVGADALEAMTSYSPSVLALNDMLRQHLQLTTNLVQSSQRLHHSLITNLAADYNYTTLEDTKRYIKKHRKKPLKFNEALKQVKAEMGIQ